MIIEMKVPSPGESVTEVQIAEWLKADGDFVSKEDDLCELDSDKATLTLNAEADGLLKILVKAGETVAVGTIVCTIDTDAKKEQKTETKAEEKVETKSEEKTETKPEEPAIQKTATEKTTPATPEKKIPDEKEVKEALEKVKPEEEIAEKKSNEDPTGFAEAIKEKPAFSRNEHREKASSLRKKLAQRLVAVKNQTAMLTTFNEVDMSAIMSIRKQYKESFKEKHGAGLGLMSFFTKAVCEALALFPVVNASLEADEIIYHDFVDMGIAVSAPKGLMVPVIRNAESQSLAEIELNIVRLANKARDGKLSLEEMSGGTFTITNGGVFGSMLSTPIINPPQSAILGMHNIVERPVAINGKVEIRPIMYLALSYDHRLIDGKDSVGFLVKVKEILENPVKLMYAGKDPLSLLLGL
jgi:2-oxoglutarate dehydrogenase E2 component (dihydrolipoamide succinyltransferase)